MQLDKIHFTKNRLRDYSSLFLRSNVNSYLEGDTSKIDYKIDRYDEQWRNRKNTTYLDYMRFVYEAMQLNYRNEYFYKNELLNDWLIKELGETNSKIFNEYKVGNSIADLVIFNGSSKAFEIKTELDTSKRLNSQLSDYLDLFNETYVVIPKVQIDNYLKLNPEIGVIAFNTEVNNFELIRKANYQLNISASSIMGVLHTAEYKSIVKEYFGELPAMTSFTMYDKCFEIIKTIPCEKLNRLFIDKMKKRKIQNELSSRYYKELNQVFLSLNLDKHKKKELIDNLQKNIKN